jgi:hypothetical protein
MNTLDFYRAAMANKLHENKAWVLSVFALTQESPTKWKEPGKAYPYRIVRTPTTVSFCSPDDLNTLIQIEDTDPSKPLLSFKKAIEMKTGSIPNLKRDITTTVGNVFFNYSCLVTAFNDRIEYMEGAINIDKVEKLIASKLEDNDSTVEGCIHVREYLAFINALFELTNFTQLCVWAATPKSMVAPPGIIDFKNKLLKENKERLHDPAVIAAINAQLVKFDADYLKGDKSMNFLLSAKSRLIVRQKLFLMHGAEQKLNESIGVELIENSLAQGWQPEKFAALNNSLRAGSYNRGAQTMLGGESVKWLLRASANITATIDDCGTTMGRTVNVNEDNYSKLIGISIIENEKSLPYTTEEEAGAYIGKIVRVRSPMYCKLDKTDYCLICVGKRLATNPFALSMAVSDYGSSFLGIFMAMAHGKALTLSKMNYRTALM